MDKILILCLVFKKDGMIIVVNLSFILDGVLVLVVILFEVVDVCGFK